MRAYRNSGFLPLQITFTKLLARLLIFRRKKSGPIAGATFQRGRKAGKSGKTLQGVVLASRTRFRKLSRTMGCGEGHASGCGLFSWPVKVHLLSQNFRSHGRVTNITLNDCPAKGYIALLAGRRLAAARSIQFLRCRMLHIRCSSLVFQSNGNEKAHPPRADGICENCMNPT
jgi:hypothetical protein